MHTAHQGLPGKPPRRHSSQTHLCGRHDCQRHAGPASTCAEGCRPHCSAFLRLPRRAASTRQEKKRLQSGRASRRHRAGRNAGRKGLTHAGVNENKTLQINSIRTVSSPEWAPVSYAGCLLLRARRCFSWYFTHRTASPSCRCRRQQGCADQNPFQVYP